jgi:hypothetical protein
MEDIVQAGGKAIAMDITDESQVQHAVDQVMNEQGNVDVLINNAGFAVFEICVQQLMAAFTQEETPDTFVKTWAAVAYQQHRLLRLLALLSHSLEKNSSEEVYRKTKLALNEGTTRLISALQRAIPSLTFAQWSEFLVFHQALVAGLWPMAQYSDMQRRVLDDLALSHFEIDFASFYEKALLIYLRGVIGENIQKTRALKPEPEPAFQVSPEIERGLEQIDDIHEMVSQLWKSIATSRSEVEQSEKKE